MPTLYEAFNSIVPAPVLYTPNTSGSLVLRLIAPFMTKSLAASPVTSLTANVTVLPPASVSFIPQMLSGRLNVEALVPRTVQIASCLYPARTMSVLRICAE